MGVLRRELVRIAGVCVAVLGREVAAREGVRSGCVVGAAGPDWCLCLPLAGGSGGCSTESLGSLALCCATSCGSAGEVVSSILELFAREVRLLRARMGIIPSALTPLLLTLRPSFAGTLG